MEVSNICVQKLSFYLEHINLFVKIFVYKN